MTKKLIQLIRPEPSCSVISDEPSTTQVVVSVAVKKKKKLSGQRLSPVTVWSRMKPKPPSQQRTRVSSIKGEMEDRYVSTFQEYHNG